MSKTAAPPGTTFPFIWACDALRVDLYPILLSNQGAFMCKMNPLTTTQRTHIQYMLFTTAK